MKTPAVIAQRDWSRFVDALVLVVVLAVAWLLGIVLVGLVEVADALLALMTDPSPYVEGPAYVAVYYAVGIGVVLAWAYIVYRFARWVWPRRLKIKEGSH